MHRNKKHTKRHSKRRGGGYGFGGSILGDAGGTGGGNVQWNQTAGECGVPRPGNMTGGSHGAERGGFNQELMGGRRGKRGGSSCASMGGRRRSRRKQPRRSRRRSRRQRGGEYATVELSGGSDPRMALQQQRAGYTFTGAGAGGIADAVAQTPVVTYV